VRDEKSPESKDLGAALLEILIGVVILGIAFVAILGVSASSIVSSDVHRQLASTETVVRAYAEAIQAKAINPPSTVLTAQLNIGGTSVQVGPVPRFPTTTGFNITIDPGTPNRETFTVTGFVSPTAWTISTNCPGCGPGGAANRHLSGAAVVGDYPACPQAADFGPALVSYIPPGGVNLPAVGVQWWIPTYPILNNSDLYGGAWVPALPGSTACSSYYSSKCGTDNRSDCYPGLALVTITAVSASAAPRNDATETQVLVRRGNS
jgi:type II secretory pathway pseudopilin PulG